MAAVEKTRRTDSGQKNGEQKNGDSSNKIEFYHEQDRGFR